MGCTADKTISQNFNKAYLKTDGEMLPFSYHYDLRKKYSFVRIINHGAYGKVKLYKDKTFKGMEFAIKTIEKGLLNKKKKAEVVNEINTLNQMDHPCIVIYYATIEDDNYYHVLMEYLCNKSISFVLNIENKIRLQSFKYIMYQTLSALGYVHNMNIVHRDIKPENIIFVNDNGKYDIKVIDFGLSVSTDYKGRNSAGTPLYMAPENIEGKVTTKSDVWSLGIIFYLYIYGKYPFEDDDRDKLLEKIQKDKIDFSNPIEKVDKDTLDLLKQMLDKNYKDRIDAVSALTHPFFSNLEREFDFEDYIQHYLDEFFNKKTMELIKAYVTSNIIKKTFLYLYTMLSPFEKREYYRKMFMALDDYFNNYRGYLKSREIFEEFKKRGIAHDEDGPMFSFINCYEFNYSKKIIAKKSKEKIYTKTNARKLVKRASLINQVNESTDFGIIQYTVFLSIFYLNEINKSVKDINEKLLYIFQLFSDSDTFIENNQNFTASTYEKDFSVEFFMTKKTFENFLYKYIMPFQFAKEEINYFFDEHPENIDFNKFKNIILYDDNEGN
jgi:serine/threonine protein kinase